MFEKGDRVLKEGSRIRGTVTGICEETKLARDKDGKVIGEHESVGDVKVHWDGTSEGQNEVVTARLLTKI